MLLLPLYPSNHNTLLQAAVLCAYGEGCVHVWKETPGKKKTEEVLENQGMSCDMRGHSVTS